MKVAHITPAFYPAYVYGGPIESVYQLCRSLADRGCEVRVLTTDANGPQTALEVDTNHAVSLTERLWVHYCRRLSGHSVAPALLQRLLEHVRWADVVHLTAVYSFPTLPTLAACQRLDKPLVWSPRGAFQSWQGAKRQWIKAVWERACGVVKPGDCVLHVTSEEEAYASQQHFPDLRISLIPNGTTIPNTVSRTDHKHHVDPASPPLRLLYLGRLHPVKAIDNLVSACHLLSTSGERNWELTIAGRGDPGYTEMLRTLIKKYRLEKHIRMVGEVVGEAKDALFGHTDVAILPSHKENFGMVVAEALARGVPVIASTGTPWQRLEEQHCGVWVENTPDKLADTIGRMRSLPVRQMGRNGRSWMMQEFSWRQRATDMVANYQTLLADRSDRAKLRGKHADYCDKRRA